MRISRSSVCYWYKTKLELSSAGAYSHNCSVSIMMDPESPG